MDRVPPHNLEAERAVLSAVLLDNDALIALEDILHPSDFYLESHEVTYRDMVSMYAAFKPIDLVTLVSYMQSVNHLDVVGGPAFLSSLGGLVSTAVNVDYWARIVREMSVLREAAKMGEEIAYEALDIPEDVPAFLDKCQAKAMELTGKQEAKVSKTVGELLTEYETKLENVEDGKDKIGGILTGIYSLDQILSGLRPGNLTLIVARTSMGKTSFAVGNALYMAIKMKRRVLFFSLEMSKEELLMKMVSNYSEIPLDRLYNYRLKDSDRAEYAKAKVFIKDAPIEIDDRSGLTMKDVRAKARREQMGKGVDIAIIDYLTRLDPDDEDYRRREHEQLFRASKAAKDLAKDLGIHVIMLGQLSFDAEKNKAEPALGDIFGSARIAQNAQVVIGLHTEGTSSKAIVLKNTMGRKGIAPMYWDGPCASFRDRKMGDKPAQKEAFND
jgi:replicative DNA helicase